MEASKRGNKSIGLMVVVFVLVNLFFFFLKNILPQYDIERNIVLIGNLILFAIGIFTLRRGLNAIDDPNPHVFVRVFYAGFIIRLFLCAIAAFLYIYLSNGAVSKASLFICMGIYILYSIIEVSALKKALRENKNA